MKKRVQPRRKRAAKKIKGTREQKIEAVLKALGKLGKRFPGTKIRKILNSNYSQGAIANGIFVKPEGKNYFVFAAQHAANAHTARQVYEVGTAVGKKYHRSTDPFAFMKGKPAEIPKPRVPKRASSPEPVDYVVPLHITMSNRLNKINAAIMYRLKRNMPIEPAWVSEWNEWWLMQKTKK